MPVPSVMPMALGTPTLTWANMGNFLMNNDDTGGIGSAPHSAQTRIIIPTKRKRGGQSVRAREVYEAQVNEFCAGILQIRSDLDFDVSSRGWCYLLEEHGLTKGEFSYAQELINDCRKAGLLPIDICCPDERRSSNNAEDIHPHDPAEHADDLIETLRSANGVYTPFSFWDAQSHYVEMAVEKIDLKELVRSGLQGVLHADHEQRGLERS